MKHKMNRFLTAGLLAALLLLSAAALAACRDGAEPSDAVTDSETTLDASVHDTEGDETDPDVSPDSSADSTPEAGTDHVAESTPEADTDHSSESSPAGDMETSQEDETPDTAEPTEDVTLGEAETGEPSAGWPEADGPLIGDGVATAGVYATFSMPGGVYTDTEFSIELTAPEGYTIRYTTNGSLPRDDNTTVYNGPITFSQSAGNGKVIRAVLYNAEGKQEGQVITQTYVTVKNTESKTYTVMITANNSYLNAMYEDVNAKVEKPAHVEIVAPNGTRVISQDVGLRLFGGSSRSLAQKSFKIIARKDGYFGTDVRYTGAGTFSYPFFPERLVLAGKNAGRVLEKYDGLILRNGGNDSLLSVAADGMDTCLLRDGIANEFVHRFAPHVGASLQHFAVVYLNGEYYGILELRENQNEDYVKRIWGVLDDDVVVIKSELDTSRKCDNHESGAYCRFCGVWFYYETDDTAAAQKELNDWIALCQKAAGAVDADEETYRKVFEEISAKIDLQNIKEYVAVSCFLCNKDWPYNNVRLWRYTGAPVDGVDITDGKFRFATRDMDMCFGRYSSPDMLPDLDSRKEVDMFAWIFGNYVGTYGEQPYPDALYLQGLFSFLLRDDTFRAEFADYCRTLASDEATEYLLALYKDAYNQVKPIVPAHIKEWGGSIAEGYNLRAWQKAAGRVESFIEERPAVFLTQLDKLLKMYQ